MQAEETQSLYERLGGVYAIAVVVDDFIDRIMGDPRLNANPRVDEAYHRAVGQARPGGIVLMHDGGGDRSQTLAALPRVIKGLRAKGYALVTVPELVLDDPPPPNQRLPDGYVRR